MNLGGLDFGVDYGFVHRPVVCKKLGYFLGELGEWWIGIESKHTILCANWR